jgi:site-specific DNA recombinase
MDQAGSQFLSIQQYAIVYTRVSTGRQVENASLDTQERTCAEYCNRMGWQVLRVFREEGESAKTADRTQLMKALDFCLKNKPRPSYFVVYDVKRFARDCEDHDALRRTLTKWDVKLRAATQNIGERPEERFLERILSGEAEYDNAVRKNRSIGGMGTRLSQGLWTFKAPLGYLNEKDKKSGSKTIVPDPERASFVREAFERYATGLYKRQAVLEWVNDKGLRTWEGKRLSTETFSRMLRNPLYAGRIEVRGTKKGAGADWRFSEKGRFKAIVPEELFDKVQSLLLGRRPSVAPRRRANPDFPLRHFVSCGNCGKPMTGSKSRSRTGEKYAYYNCQNKKCLARVSVPGSRLESDFFNYLLKLKPNADYLKAFRETVVPVYESRFQESLAMKETLERDLRLKRDQRKKLNDAFVYDKAIDASTYRQMKEANEQESLILELKINEVREEEIEIEELLDFSDNLLMNAAGTWNQSGLEQKQRLQQVLFPKGVTYLDGVYRTSATGPMFNLLEAATQQKEELVALPGIEPGF